MIKQIFNILRVAISKLLREELKSTAGKVNLIGGVLLIILTIALAIEDIVVYIGNVLLKLMNKTVSEIAPWQILLLVLGIGAYFLICTWLIANQQNTSKDNSTVDAK